MRICRQIYMQIYMRIYMQVYQRSRRRALMDYCDKNGGQARYRPLPPPLPALTLLG